MILTHAHPNCRVHPPTVGNTPIAVKLGRSARPSLKLNRAARAALRCFATVPDELKITEASLKRSFEVKKKTIPAREQAKLCSLLDRAGFKNIECGEIESDFLKQLGLKSLAAKLQKVSWKSGGIQGLNLGAKPSAILRLSYLTAASEEYTYKHYGKTNQESLKRLRTLLKVATSHQLPVKVYLSCAFHCPYEGLIPPSYVAEKCIQLLSLGCAEVVPVDTNGRATPKQVQNLIKSIRERAYSESIVVTSERLSLLLKGNDKEKLDAALESNVNQFETALMGRENDSKSPPILSTQVLLSHAYHRGIITGIQLDLVKIAKRELTKVVDKIG